MMRNYIEKSTYCGIIFIHGKGGSMLVGTKIFLIRGWQVLFCEKKYYTNAYILGREDVNSCAKVTQKSHKQWSTTNNNDSGV